MNTYTTVIGLEVHVQLDTESKIFSSDRKLYGQEPNSNISPVSLALPGTLPVLNTKAVRSAVKLGHALGCNISRESRFDRKNYFYPDLPKGYQITQDAMPICIGGALTFETDGKSKTVKIHHIHLEEDAGKNSHDLHDRYSLVDINRAGTPLVEIVTEPDLRSAQEVHDFIAALQQLVRYIDISDGNMEEGSLRCDVNVSVMPEGSDTYGERNEIKNVNSKKFAKTAVEYESKRQISILESGGTIAMNTLLFDATKGTTAPMRSKEEANDYRYLPDPDLPPVKLSEEYINEVSEEVTLLPWTAKDTLKTYGLSDYDTEILCREKSVVEYFTSFSFDGKKDYSNLADFIINKALPFVQTNESKLSGLNKDNIRGFISFLDSGLVAKSAAMNQLSEITLTSIESIDFKQLAEQNNLLQSEDQDFLDDIIADIIGQNQPKVTAYQKGKKGLLGFFVGQVMRQSQGKANPKIVNEKVMKALEE